MLAMTCVLAHVTKDANIGVEDGGYQQVVLISQLALTVFNRNRHDSVASIDAKLHLYKH